LMHPSRRNPDSTGDSGYGTTDEAVRGRTVRLKLLLLIALAALHVVVTMTAIVPGYLSIDEVAYDLMSKNFSETWGLEIRNGYDEFPSPELVHRFWPLHAGRTVPQYPYLFSALALPLYGIAGYFGLFLTNALAFVGVVFLSFLTARRLFDNADLALNACLILVGATFAWEYSQAAWPHATALLFISAAFYFGVEAYLAGTRRAAVSWALVAGLVTGLAPGVRLDSFLVFFAILIPFMFARPWRPLELSALALGTLPGLTLTAATNHAKFGTFSPFTYGGGTYISLEFGLTLGTLGLVLWVVTRPAFHAVVRGNRPAAVAVAAAGVLILLLVSQTRSTMLYMATNAYISLLDIRALDPGVFIPAATRSPGWGVVYIGAHKKALLQSMPYLPVLLVPFLALFRRNPDFYALGTLFLVPATFIGFFSYTPHEYAGLCLNYRYYLAFLPFTAILSAYALRDIKEKWHVAPGLPVWVIVSSLTAAGFLFLTERLTVTLEEQEFTLLVVPVLIACFLTALLVAASLLKSEGVRLLRESAVILVIVGMAWSASVAFLYDYPHHRKQRVQNYGLGGEALSVVPPDSIFFTAPFIDPFMRVLEKDRVRLALPASDGFKDFPGLLAFHLNAGRRAFAVFPEAYWKELKAGPLKGYRVRPVLVFPGSYMAEITSGEATSSGPED
jgi:hypothetical protein